VLSWDWQAGEHLDGPTANGIDGIDYIGMAITYDNWESTEQVWEYSGGFTKWMWTTEFVAIDDSAGSGFGFGHISTLTQNGIIQISIG